MDKRLYFLILGLTSSLLTFGQQDKDTTVIESVEIRSKQSASSPIGHTLDYIYLSRNALLRNQGNTFINTLEKIPGISAINTGVGIAKPVIRGMSLNRVIVNEFGIKQEGQQWGVDHGLEIDQYNVDQVEILKGPVSVLYGSDGIGGVINILPSPIPYSDTFGGSVLVNYKSNNNLKGVSAQLYAKQNAHYTLFRITAQHFGDYKVPADSFYYNRYKLPIYNNRLKNTSGKEFNVSLLHRIEKSWGQANIYLSNFYQQSGFFVGAFGKPRAYQLTHDGSYNDINDPYQNLNHFKAIINTHFHLPKGRLEADFGLQHNYRQEKSSLHQHGNNPNVPKDLALSLKLLTANLNFRYSLENARYKNVIAFTNAFQQNRIGGYEFLIPNYHTFQTGISNFFEYRPSAKWLINAGLRLDFATQNIKQGVVETFDNNGNLSHNENRNEAINKQYYNVSGSIGTNYILSHHHQFKINIGSAYRIPAVVELAANGVHHGTFRHELGNAYLNPERGAMFDISWDYHHRFIKWGVTPFVNYFDNYIYLSPSGRYSTLAEAGQIYNYIQAPVIFWGGEIDADIDIYPSLKWNTNVEYVWNKNINTDLGLPFTPPMSWMNELVYKPKNLEWLNGFQIFVNGQYFSAQNRVDRNEPTTPSYFLMNFGASHTFHLGQTKLNFMLQVRNLLNEQYLNNMSRYRILNLPEQGRNIQALVKIDF